VEITGIDTPFLDALAHADLLVSFMSSTIEQALQARVPVLLWGPTRRHVHIPARAEPPTDKSRSAVYVAHNGNHLRSMLKAIRDWHLGIPLTDEETAGLVWPDASTRVPDAVMGAIEQARHQVAERSAAAACAKTQT
jgi:hypothetical protein